MKAGGGFEGKDRDSFMSLYSRLKRLGHTVLLIYSSLHRFFFILCQTASSVRNFRHLDTLGSLLFFVFFTTGEVRRSALSH